tara:strand:- start:1024 stop:1359 length:336 start_codon:yes stop_codon:yes gene_type:complete
MGWLDILKRRGAGVSSQDINMVNYIMRDGNFRTPEVIIEEIYEEMAHSKKLGNFKAFALKETGRPMNTRFGVGRSSLKTFLTKSPLYESRDTGNKTDTKMPITEFRYIGVQ